MAEAASCLELKASFFNSFYRGRLGIPFDAAWRTARWWSLHGSQWDTRPARKSSRLLLAVAEVTTVVHRLWDAPPLARVGVWIDNMRTAESKSDATLWEAQVFRNADGRHATMWKDSESGATQYTFLGARFDHTHRAVFLSEKFVRSVRAMSALNF
ncbi:hypothetical protein C3747_224g70 [Trypanosoma cruzi]|uniref:Target of rapamycin (TOR) kinase 1 n=1 Tax=Trypanosoma cruzi TaxID=5693 RepID=A0A2V2VR21_TRYCR|nr:hypothetical protein C3747_589g4 [Trypanosoma cruzi]PWU98889.1 hypothetical protein C3747_224g70 [Trypanosoma cruzi]RNC36082.1 putative target of rapamycin (TOR) kinase 1 [Trypanosoma cruzi]